MLRNMLCIAMKNKIDGLEYGFDNLLRGFQILRENVIEKKVPTSGHQSCSVSDFHSLMMSFRTLLENTCEDDFLNYVQNEDDVRSKYIEMSNERESLVAAYQIAMQKISDLDLKLKEIINEKNALISSFEELKEMLFDGSFQTLPINSKQKITSMIESLQRASIGSSQSHHVSQDVTKDDVKAEFSTFMNDASSVNDDNTEIFIPESSNFFIPETDDAHDIDLSNSESDKVKLTGDMQVITVTWDEMTDKSCDVEDYRVTRRKRKAKSKTSVFPKHWISCKICGRPFTKKKNLERHENLHTVTGRLRQFSCAICHKSYITNSDLNRHIRIHSNERFYCPTCGKSFTQSGTLQRHVKIHSNIKEFICNDCNKAYTSKWALKAHIVLKTCPFAKY